MIDEIKVLFVSEVMKIRYKCLDDFLSTKMEENVFLERHVVNMYRIQASLVHVWDYRMTNRFAVAEVLRSLPPIYKDHVMGYVMEEKMFTFHGIVIKLRTLRVVPIVGEVIDGEGIYGMRVINVFP
jgi:hypothetical protein